MKESTQHFFHSFASFCCHTTLQNLYPVSCTVISNSLKMHSTKKIHTAERENVLAFNFVGFLILFGYDYGLIDDACSER